MNRCKYQGKVFLNLIIRYFIHFKVKSLKQTTAFKFFVRSTLILKFSKSNKRAIASPSSVYLACICPKMQMIVILVNWMEKLVVCILLILL